MRSFWKGYFINSLILRQLYFLKNIETQRFALPIMARSSTILSDFVGLNVEVYNGQRFIKLNINEDMVGHKFGEFSFTKKMGHKIHPPIIVKSKKKKTKTLPVVQKSKKLNSKKKK